MRKSTPSPAVTHLSWQARAEMERRRRQASPPGSRWETDFLAFVGMVDIIPKDGRRGKLRPNAIQAAFEVSWTGRDIILKPRQIGMTTWEVAKDVWFFLTRQGAQVVIVVQSMSDDAAIREVSGKLRVMFESLASFGIAANVERVSSTEWVDRKRDAKLRIASAGASEAAAEKKGRSGTIHRLHITELAFFEYARETLNAMLECVPGADMGSQIVIESTPNGAAGLFFDLYQAAKAGKTAYHAHFFRWLGHAEYQTTRAAGEVVTPETPRERELASRHHASQEQVKWYRAKVAEKGQRLVDQEYPLDEVTCWLSDGAQFFDVERTEAIRAATRSPIETRVVGKEGSRGVLRVWQHPQHGRTYVIAVDPSEGVGGDPGAAVVLDRGTGAHVATIHGQFTTWDMARVVAEVGRLYRDAVVAVERNNHGHAVLQGLVREHKYPQIYAGHDKRAGWLNSEVTRSAALDAMHNAHRQGHWSSPELETLDEMRQFVVIDGKPQAVRGAHDDLILAHAIGWDVVCKPTVHRSIPSNVVA